MESGEITVGISCVGREPHIKKYQPGTRCTTYGTNNLKGQESNTQSPVEDSTLIRLKSFSLNTGGTTKKTN